MQFYVLVIAFRESLSDRCKGFFRKRVFPMFLKNFSRSLKSNSVALISLVIALSSFFYGAYRQERTERNMNVRQASFEMLKQLGELQLIVNRGYFEKNSETGNPMLGWGYIAFISDLSVLLPSDVKNSTDHLIAVWKQEWKHYKDSEESADKISQASDEVRLSVRRELTNLH